MLDQNIILTHVHLVSNGGGFAFYPYGKEWRFLRRIGNLEAVTLCIITHNMNQHTMY